jgi:hypothetical protein
MGEQHKDHDEEDAEMDEKPAPQAVRHRKSLNDQQKYAAYVAMHALCMSNGGKFRKSDKKQIATFFKADIQIIQRIWKTAMRQIGQGLEVDVSNKKKGRCGRKPINVDLTCIPTIPLNKRSTIRSLAWQLGASPTTLYRRFKLKQIKRCSNSLKPALTESNMMARVQFCLDNLDEATKGNPEPKFTTMHNVVHIDEKWFMMTKENRNYYLLPEEEEPPRAVQNKNCIGKVMFLTAVARPRFDSAGKVTFSGKIGIWPFVKEIPAARRSENRPRGTLETKSIKVTREVMREFFIEKVLPAIKLVWPEDDGGEIIFIQQDNAKPHILPNDLAFAEAAANIGLVIKLIQQPPNSPDLNVLDLGFFRSLHSLTDTRSPKTLKDLIKDVEEEFDDYDSSELNKIFLSLQACMVEIMNHGGEIRYDTPHGHKDVLERLKILPTRLKCPLQVYQNALKAVAAAVAKQAEATQAQETQAAEETQADTSSGTSKQPKQRKRKRIEVGTSLAEQAEATQAQETQAAEATQAEASSSTTKQPKQRKRKRMEVGTSLAKQAEATQAQETQAAEATQAEATQTQA